MNHQLLHDAMVAVLMVVVLVWATLNHFIFAWTGNSPSAAWMAATDESVFQHLKMMLWPWLFVTLTFDLCWRAFGRGRMGMRGVRSWPSLQTVFLANVVALAIGMLFMSVVFAVIWYASGQQELLVPNIVLFTVSLVGAQLLRLVLFRYEKQTALIAGVLLMYGIVWLFTYTSYRDNLREGFWFDKHEESDNH